MITEGGGILPKAFDFLSLIILFLESKYNNSEVGFMTSTFIKSHR